MNIDSIKNGYVIDHISAGQAMKIYEYLKLGDLDCQVKIDFDVLGYINPNITINVIENDKKVKKFHPELKEELIDIVKCKNPRCITSVERGLKHICVLKDKNMAKYRCKYCDSEV